MDAYFRGFEKHDDLRSAYIRDIILRQLEPSTFAAGSFQIEFASIPKRLIRYWHDPSELPEDVRACMESWDRLVDEGFELLLFNDVSAAAFIAETYSDRERRAFARCGHPAMRSDYLRMCCLLADGGLYVDVDDVLLGDGWRDIFTNGTLKVQPLCYDIAAKGMMPSSDIWRADLSTSGRVFYVNNDPIAAPVNHPVLRRALRDATEKLLDDNRFPEIQSTTGPGNLTAALAAHARVMRLAGLPADFELLRDWDSIAEMRWDLSYRRDTRNWRNVYGC